MSVRRQVHPGGRRVGLQLVAQAVGDQPCDICFPLPEQPRARIASSRGGDVSGFTKQERQGRVPAQAFSGRDFGLEVRGPKRRYSAHRSSTTSSSPASRNLRPAYSRIVSCRR